MGKTYLAIWWEKHFLLDRLGILINVNSAFARGILSTNS
jgi:hypothetical protein